MQEITDARRSGVAPPAVSIMIAEEYPDLNGEIVTSLFTDVQLIYNNRRQGGAQAKIVKTLSFKAADKRIV